LKVMKRKKPIDIDLIIVNECFRTTLSPVRPSQPKLPKCEPGKVPGTLKHIDSIQIPTKKNPRKALLNKNQKEMNG